MNESPSSQTATKQKRVMLIEDDEFLWRAYKDGLTRAGLGLSVVTDGGEAVDKVREVMPDLILLDLILPGKDGFEILSELMKDADLKGIPVLVLSNLGQSQDIKRALDLGAVDYLVKTNTSMREVLAKVKVCLGSS